MRKKTKDDAKKPSVYRGAKNPCRLDNDRIDLVSNSGLTGRDEALAALDRMKRLEAKFRDRMHVLRIDERTTIASNRKEGLERMVNGYNSL